ncbi:MAG: LysR substrate-binding domain-containing protein [Pseudomonadota bacterium]
MPFRRLPPLNALRAFEAVARNSSIKIAADEMSVTPAAVSQQVKKLEDDLGVMLFQRRTRHLEITAPGQVLADGLKEAFLQMRRAVDDVRPRQREQCIVVACGPPFAAKFLTPRLAPFLDTHPDLEVRLVSDFRRMDYEEHQIDLGVRLTDRDAEGLDFEWLDEEQVLPLASPDYVSKHDLKRPEDLTRATLLDDENESLHAGVTKWADWFDAAGVPGLKPKRVINFGVHIDQSLDAAVAGMGVVLGTAVLAQSDLNAERLVNPFGPTLGMGLRHQVVMRPGAVNRPQVLLFKEWLASEITATIGSPQ